jgi:hypothetical protein
MCGLGQVRCFKAVSTLKQVAVWFRLCLVVEDSREGMHEEGAHIQ